jgi:Rrf2 family protein
MLSNKTKYGLRAVLQLAEEYGRGPVLIADLAGKQQIPKKFLEQILLELKNAGILQSKSGKGGGYYLGRRPEDVTFGQVIRILDGPIAPVPCVSKTAYAKCAECADEATCSIRLVMADVREAISSILDRTSFSAALDRSRAAALEVANVAVYQI